MAYLSTTTFTNKPSPSIAARVKNNHYRIATKNPDISPASGEPIKAEIYGDKIAFVSPTIAGEPLVFIQPLPHVRMAQATLGDLAKLNGRIAPTLPDRFQKAVDELLTVLARAEHLVARADKLAAESATD
jgi:hypothetical protein